ncbi:ABC transporter substrate-binding protein [Chelatococcus reniformis]|uniref:Branched-chain amino acid ABC transporter substrate-binding protein n=1 Tax=Chelatococcus reniformis TaxID=1494448 RepID=A0A916UND8_9HYPH|nr:ABC transporter substrate-binding protein [Chelatococcus reniformis]GGC79164.1 branched-chain amino acid ABC transporter substrate-binding protein [Chelatococcus reniformis]
MKHRMGTWASLLALAQLACGPATAGTYDEGATDTTIKIGNVAAASGAVAIYLPYREALSRCFAKINADGGIHGRKIEFISYDDGYNPARTVEQTRRLVEGDGVLFLVGGVGTATSLAAAPYLAQKKVPHLFVASSASKISDAELFPWMMGWQPAAAQEGAVFARYMVDTLGTSKIGVLYQNDDFGRDFLAGVKAGLGADGAGRLVAARPYEAAEPTITSQIAQIKAAGADTVYLAATGKFVAQGIKAIRELGWQPNIFIPYVANSPELVLKAADLKGDEKLFSAAFLKDPGDPRQATADDVKEWLAWMDKYYAGGNTSEVFNVWGWSICQTVAHVLRQAGDTLTRANVLKAANSLRDYRPPLVLPGILLSSSPTQHRLVKCLQLQRFAAGRWAPEGEVACAE